MPSSGSALRAHHHPAAEEAAVADHRVDHPAAARLAVDGDAHLTGLPAEEDGQRGPVVRDLRRRAPSTISFARCAIAPEMPALATFANSVRPSSPAPRAIRGDADVDRHAPCPSARRRSRRSMSRGMSKRAHEVPARAARDHRQLDAAAPPMPFTTSFTDPSPPTTTRRVAPPDTASGRERREVPRALGDERVAARARRAGGAMRDLRPALARRAARERGLTRKTVRPLMAVARRGRRVESDPRHAVDRRPELVVRDPHELALDDDVAHGQEAAAVDAADGGRA